MKEIHEGTFVLVSTGNCFVDPTSSEVLMVVGRPDTSELKWFAPVFSKSGRIYLRQEPEMRYEDDHVYLIPVDTKISSQVDGYAVFFTDHPGWMILDLTGAPGHSATLVIENGKGDDGLEIVTLDPEYGVSIYDSLFEADIASVQKPEAMRLEIRWDSQSQKFEIPEDAVKALTPTPPTSM